MKQLLLICLVLTSLPVFGGISILSDLDDTIKITQSSGKVIDYVASDVFTGMPEFLNASRDFTKELHILSASPSFLKAKIKLGLKNKNIKFNSLVLRANIAEEKLIYKIRMIKNLLANSSDDFILIGDDYGQDPEVYTEIKKLFPTRIKEAYIHVIKGRDLPKGITPYWTSFDLFLREYTKQRMTPAWIEEAANQLLNESDFRKIIPRKASCPTEERIFDWQILTVFQPEAYKVTSYLIKKCRSFQSSILIR